MGSIPAGNSRSGNEDSFIAVFYAFRSFRGNAVKSHIVENLIWKQLLTEPAPARSEARPDYCLPEKTAIWKSQKHHIFWLGKE